MVSDEWYPTCSACYGTEDQPLCKRQCRGIDLLRNLEYWKALSKAFLRGRNKQSIRSCCQCVRHVPVPVSLAGWLGVFAAATLRQAPGVQSWQFSA